MFKFLGGLIKIVAAIIVLTGGLVATQSKIGAAEVLLIAVALVVFADVLAGIGGFLGNNRSKEPAVSGSD